MEIWSHWCLFNHMVRSEKSARESEKYYSSVAISLVIIRIKQNDSVINQKTVILEIWDFSTFVTGKCRPVRKT